MEEEPGLMLRTKAGLEIPPENHIQRMTHTSGSHSLTTLYNHLEGLEKSKEALMSAHYELISLERSQGNFKAPSGHSNRQ